MVWAFDPASSALVVFGCVSVIQFSVVVLFGRTDCSVVLIVRSFGCWSLGRSLNRSVVVPGTLRSFILSVVQVFGRLLFGCSAHWWPFSGLFFVGPSLGEIFPAESFKSKHSY